MTEDEKDRWHRDSMDTSLKKLQEMVKGRGTWCSAVHGLQRVGCDGATEQQRQRERLTS